MWSTCLKGWFIGPLLFLLYINDLCNVSKALNFMLLIVLPMILTYIFFLIKTQINWWKLWIPNWRNYQACFRPISFLLHKKKWNFILFKTGKNLTFNLWYWNLSCKWSFVFRSYTWRTLIMEISNTERSKKSLKISLGIIYKLSFCLNKTSLCTLCYSLVYPYLYYCVSVWGSSYQSNLKRLTALQKQVISQNKFQEFFWCTYQSYFCELTNSKIWRSSNFK